MKRGYLKICLILLVLVGSIVNAATIWTTDVDGNPKDDYAPIEYVYIHGEGFTPLGVVIISITRPDSSIDTDIAVADATGYFLYVYDLQGIEGTYYVHADDGTYTADVTFTDATVWTTDGEAQQKNEFDCDEPIGLDGSDMTPSTTLDYYICDSPSCNDNIVEEGEVDTDENGSIVFTIIWNVPEFYANGGTQHKVVVEDDQDKSKTFDVDCACVDEDQDTYYAYDAAVCPTGTDCDDSNPNIHPGATEVCDSVDDDCDGEITDVLPTACDDGVPCTVDACVAPNCVHTPNHAVCDDSNICTDDTCSEGIGCTYSYNTLPCEDGLFCTENDLCAGGVCIGGNPINPSDGVSCTDDYCDEELDVIINTPNDAHCDNGYWCDGVEYCDAAQDCQAGTPVDCSQYTDQCNFGVCDEDSDSCYAEPANEGYPCDDGLFCNAGETCQAGVCVGGQALDCSGYDDECNVGMCDEGQDTCYAEPVADSTPCDDGLFCTEGETCYSGVCGQGISKDCSFYDIPAVNTCYYIPDGLDYTRDTYPGFTSICLEETDECSTSQESIESVCDISCGAGCEEDANCGDKCVGEVFNYGGSCDLGDCECDYTTEDCNQYDDWYDTTNYQWVNTDECNEKEQVEQEYRDYYCDVQGCDYSVTDNRWQDTVGTRYEQYGTVCDDGLYCTVSDVCDGYGVCDGSARDCSAFDNECNLALCDEDADSCYAEPEPYNYGEPCSEGVGECYAEGTIQCDGYCDAIPGNPSAEECDGLDNDCDGDIDDGLGTSPTICGVGECVSAGELSCVDGSWVDDCVAGSPTTETCDGLDNDCDGDVDEDIDPNPISCGVGECYNTGYEYCVQGAWFPDCMPGTPTAEICDNLDNDCDGDVDEGLTQGCSNACFKGTEYCTAGVWGGCDAPPEPVNLGEVCSVGVGECYAEGTIQCDESCSAVAGTPTTEICDGLDNDCNGEVDDIPSNPTSCGIGECYAQGQESCVGGVWVDDCTPLSPSAEICDALDNDCDELVDEDLTRGCSNACFSGTEYCSVGVWGGCDAEPEPYNYGEPCSVGVGACESSGTIDCDGLCNAVEGTPTTEVCDGIDNDCDGYTDEDLGSTPTTCGTVGQCYGEGELICIDGEWVDTCEYGTMTEEICDGIDNDCNGKIDDGIWLQCGMDVIIGNSCPQILQDENGQEIDYFVHTWMDEMPGSLPELFVGLGYEDLLDIAFAAGWAGRSYAFDGELIAFRFSAYDPDGIMDDCIQGYVTLDDGYDPRVVQCVKEVVDENTAEFICAYYVEDAETRQGEYWVSVEVADDCGNGCVDKGAGMLSLYLNPAVGLRMETQGTDTVFAFAYEASGDLLARIENGEIVYGPAAGDTVYTPYFIIENAADPSSGLYMLMTLYGTDFMPEPDTVALCEGSNVLDISNVEYLARHLNAEEGWTVVPDGTNYGEIAADYIFRNWDIEDPGFNGAANFLGVGDDITMRLRLHIPEQCSGQFTQGGEIIFVGKVI